LPEDFGQNAIRGGREFDCRFLGFEENEVLVLANGLSFLLEPRSDLDFCDGFAERRDNEFE
jgi:hypothetical protein